MHYVDELRSRVMKDFDATVTAHDFSHLIRVENNARRFAYGEKADISIVRSAALLHDYHRYLEMIAGHHVSPHEAESLVRLVLAEAGAPVEHVDHICECIVFTERFHCAGDDINLEKISIEALIVRDADMLDALGAVGIARAMMFGAKLGEPLTSNSPISPRFVPGKSSSIVHHFHEKLLSLETEFYTRMGKIEAAQRSCYMRAYLSVLESELAFDN